MTTTIPSKELTPELLAEIQKKGSAFLDQAASFMEISGIEDFNAAGPVITGLKKCETDIENMIDAHFKPRLDALKFAADQTRKDRDESKAVRVKPLVDARKGLMDMADKFQREETARRNAAAQKLRQRMNALALVMDRTPMNEVEVMSDADFDSHLEAARVKYQEFQRQREEEAALAAAQNRVPELPPEPEPEPLEVYIPTAPAVQMKGVSSRANWKWRPAGSNPDGSISGPARLTALKALAEAAIKEPHLLELLDFNDKALAALAKSAGPAGMPRPGIEFYNAPVTSVRGA